MDNIVSTVIVDYPCVQTLGIKSFLIRCILLRIFSSLRQTASWMSDYLAVRPSAIGQPTWPTKPSIPQGR